LKGGYPTTIEELQAELATHSKDGRSDAGFRLNIALSQMGNLAAHFTHDQKENPIARPYGTKESEKSDAGHAMLQVMTYCALRGINLQDAINSALDNLRSKDFVRKEVLGNEHDVRGEAIVRCCVQGEVWVCPDPNFVSSENLNRHHGKILVISHPLSDARLQNFAGIITDQGGMACHAAIIARECEIPCIVGTGNATRVLKSGNIITMNSPSPGRITLGIVKRL